MRKNRFLKTLLAVYAALLGGCATDSLSTLAPVHGFELSRYLGTWYEVARLDHSFERGLNCVSADYAVRADGRVEVINRGYDAQKKQWQEARGVAVFMGSPNEAFLKVSFFRPFYGLYKVVALDKENYRWAMVAGGNTDYLWLLSRDKTLPTEIKQKLLDQAAHWGFKTDALIWPEPHCAL